MTPDVVVDIGNTRMKWGLCRNGRIERIASLQSANPDAWAATAERWQVPQSAKWVITWVNSSPLIPFAEWLSSRGDTYDGIASHKEVGLPLAVDEPDRVGIDRLLTALAAVRRVRVGRPVATINVGAAMTIDYVNPDGVFLGGIIMPGPATMAKSLRNYTAQLPRVEPEPMMRSSDYCGKNTVDAIKSGISYAIVGAAYDAIWSFANDMGLPVSVYVTGGGARFIDRDYFPDEVEEIVFDRCLTLDGIRIAAGALP